MAHPLGAHLKRLVEERRGMKINEFARDIGVNGSGLHQLIRGERKSLDSATIEKIARGLRMTPAELATVIGQGPDDDPEVAETLSIIRAVPREYLAVVRRVGLSLLEDGRGKLIRTSAPSHRFLAPAAA